MSAILCLLQCDLACLFLYKAGEDLAASLPV